MPSTRPPVAPVQESATTALYRAALGPVNTARCLDVFERFDEAGRSSPVWNPAAGFLTLNWMVFRQLWSAAFLYVVGVGGLALLAVGLGRHFLQWPQGVEWGVLGALLLLSIGIPGAYGYAILHADTRKRMARAVSQASTVREACATLAQQASSKRRLWVLVVVNVLLAAAAVGAYVAKGSRGSAQASAVVAPEVPVQAVAAAALAPAAPSEPTPEPVAPPVPTPEPVAAPAPPPVSEVPPAATLAPVQPEPAPAPAPKSSSAASPSPAKPPQTELSPQTRATKPAVDSAPQAHGINAGLFADRANAEKVHERLVDAGFAAILQTVERPAGPLTRVRVGPFASRALADEAATRIRAMGLDAAVFRP